MNNFLKYSTILLTLKVIKKIIISDRYSPEKKVKQFFFFVFFFILNRSFETSKTAGLIFHKFLSKSETERKRSHDAEVTAISSS